MRKLQYKVNGSLWLWILMLFLQPALSFGQNIDSTKTFMGSSMGVDSMSFDTTKIVEDAALDIGQNRGLFIVTPGGEMQLRILGSVRYLIVYDEYNLEHKNVMDTYEITVGEDNIRLPNYYNGLQQSRLGFEITRRVEEGNVFVRLETDFAGPNGFGGPTVSLGLEYFTPDYSLPDSVLVESFQLIPDLTGRIQKQMEWGALQLSVIVPILTARTEEGNFVLRPGRCRVYTCHKEG